MRYKLLLLLNLMFMFAQAMHVKGGDISYEYIGDSLNPHRYEISLQLLRSDLGYMTPSIDYSSPCYGTYSIFLNLTPVLNYDADTICVDSAGVTTNTLYVYKGTVDLPGNCYEWKFSYTVCCRENFDNLDTNNSDDVYFEAYLNYDSVHNSSVKFEGPVEKYLCVNPSILQTLEFPFTESDGDSVNFILEAPNANSLSYRSPYTTQNPINSTGGISINSKTGDIRLIPSKEETVIFTIAAEEYRMNTSSGIWDKVGVSKRDVIVKVLENCSNISINWEISAMDTIVNKQLNAQCNDSIIKIFTTFPFNPASLDKGGSDFRINNSKTSAPIHSAKAVGKNEIELTLYFPVSFNDTLYLYSKTGNDGNTLINKCGRELAGFDSIMVIFEGCNTAGRMENAVAFDIYPNPVQNELQIRMTSVPETAFIEIMDLSGRIVLQQSMENEMISAIGVEFLPQGMYILKMRSKAGIHSKLFKKK